MKKIERDDIHYNETYYLSSEADKEIAQLQAEVEALRKDAARYQWLCNKGYNYHEAIAGSGSMSICRGPYILLEPPSHNKFSNLVLGKQSADVLIDTAIAKDTQLTALSEMVKLSQEMGLYEPK
jgi:hypothetical protein